MSGITELASPMSILGDLVTVALMLATGYLPVKAASALLRRRTP